MSTFAEQFEALDTAIIAALGDDALINGAPVRGIFEAPYIGPKIGNTRTEISEPNFHARTVDVASAATGQVLEIRDVSYTIVRIELTGEGITTLVLRRV